MKCERCGYEGMEPEAFTLMGDYCMACVHEALGERDEIIAWLHRWADYNEQEGVKDPHRLIKAGYIREVAQAIERKEYEE